MTMRQWKFSRDAENFHCRIVKDRGQRLGRRVQLSAGSPQGLYRVIEKAVGSANLDRETEASKAITSAQKDRIAELVRRLDISPEKVRR